MPETNWWMVQVLVRMLERASRIPAALDMILLIDIETEEPRITGAF